MELSRPVVVKRMPEKVNQREARKFLADVQPFLNADRPQLVFDLSTVRQLDAAGVEMLLHCVSEVMKRDGDLKLASLSPQAAMVLELTRTDRLFEIYETSTEAARSFSGFLPNAMRPIPVFQQPTTTERLAA
ncbi:MAG TPA: STAS domain-containing protein [Terriglobales bacterium]|nr:STAS domain-containing protein [Terriglobales bacterium]